MAGGKRRVVHWTRCRVCRRLYDPAEEGVDTWLATICSLECLEKYRIYSR